MTRCVEGAYTAPFAFSGALTHPGLPTRPFFFQFGETPLFAAATEGEAAVVAVLLSHPDILVDAVNDVRVCVCQVDSKHMLY